jgi:hypothetical protein
MSSRYTGNYFWGGNATRPFYNLLDPTDTTHVRSVKGSQVKKASEFIIAGENAGVSKAYKDQANVKNILRFHYPKFDRWNMLFADGHSSAVLIDKEPVQASDGPSSGPGWRFEWKTNN